MLTSYEDAIECVVNVVNHAMVQKMNLASSTYPRGVSEFEKAGFTPIPSEQVKPPRVKESPVQMECKVNQIVELRKNGGAGNLIIAEVLILHISENILNDQKMIDPHKIDLISRMNANWYCWAHGNALFELPKLEAETVLGMNAIPVFVKQSYVFFKQDLILLISTNKYPLAEGIQKLKQSLDRELNTLTKENFYLTLCHLAKW